MAKLTGGMRARPPRGLMWGIKQSFVAYVRGTPDAQGSVTDGATVVGGDQFHFEEDCRSEVLQNAQTRSWAFRGDVRFSGHSGLLYVRVAHPWIRTGNGAAELSVEDLYQNPGAPRLVLATMQLERRPSRESVETWAGSDVRLSAAGAELFMDVYQPGELFDPLTLTVSADATRR